MERRQKVNKERFQQLIDKVDALEIKTAEDKRDLVTIAISHYAAEVGAVTATETVHKLLTTLAKCLPDKGQVSYQPVLTEEDLNLL